ncbi:MAG: flavin reductase family protein [Bdellovibrionales bacterium]|nr:flavin reductase family protein [Bdellovibrionales bacterium]
MADSPNPNWKPKEKFQVPFDEMQSLDCKQLETSEIYKILIGTVLPRPIALVSTVNASGLGNLAPFSFFNAVSSKPPALMIAVGNKVVEEKDTAKNINETKEFVINIASEWLIEPLVYTAGNFPYGVNEMEEAGFTPLKSELVRPPRVKESPVQFECKLMQSVKLGEDSIGSTTLFIGEILKIHIAKNAYENGKINFDKIKSIGRLGGYQYCSIKNIFELRPPKL